MKAKPVVASLLIIGLTFLIAQTGFSQSSQPPARVYDEARTVYLGNLARRQNGVPPLRWNRQLTQAARWFSWDSVENRPTSYCGHQDTQGHWPDWRALAFGYQGHAGAENAFCGYVTPDQAIQGWMGSPGHRDNLLNPSSREVGLGYYLRENDGRGYVTQAFGHDPIYPPVIINNEAISTTYRLVNLYIYDRKAGGGFAGMGPAVQMMVSDDACFADAAWEAYAAERSWTLESGRGWREVYVKTQDALRRSVVVSDAIYLGSNVPLDQLGLAQTSTTQQQITLYNLDGGGLPSMQFSLGWLADDTFDTFALLWGNGERVSDPDAWGGTAFRLRPGSGESFAWVWTTEFIQEQPLVAYFRLKVSDNSSVGEVARISVEGGGAEYGPLRLNGTDFARANHYQEFPLAFTFHTNAEDPFLIFNFWRSGSADVYVDVATIFTPPEPVISPLTWSVPGGNYRGQGVWVRYTDGNGGFSPITEPMRTPGWLEVSPNSLTFLVARNGEPPPPSWLDVQVRCGSSEWQAWSNAAWLRPHVEGDAIQVRVDPTGLDVGSYQATLTVEATTGEGISPVSVPVTLTVVEQLNRIFLPVIRRNW